MPGGEAWQARPSPLPGLPGRRQHLEQPRLRQPWQVAFSSKFDFIGFTIFNAEPDFEPFSDWRLSFATLTSPFSLVAFGGNLTLRGVSLCFKEKS